MPYEVDYLITGEFDEQKAQDFAKKMEGVVSGFGKNIVLSEPKRIRLAFPVKKQREGFLVSIDFTAEPKNIIEMAKELKREKEILRFLFVKKSAKKAEEPKARVQAVKPEVKEKEETKEISKKELSKKEKVETVDRKEGLKKIKEDLDKILNQ